LKSQMKSAKSMQAFNDFDNPTPAPAGNISPGTGGSTLRDLAEEHLEVLVYSRTRFRSVLVSIAKTELNLDDEKPGMRDAMIVPISRRVSSRATALVVNCN
jgi:hypothetical protein